MSYWRKGTGSKELIEIARIALGPKDEDYIEYRNYNAPFYHLKFPVQVLGFNSTIKDWEKTISEQWKENSLDMSYSEYRDYHLVQKVNYWLDCNLRWKGGKSAKHQFNEAKDMYYYFEKERSFLE